MITLSHFQFFFLVGMFVIGWAIAFGYGYLCCKDAYRGTALSTADEKSPTVLLVGRERFRQ